mmetsp:Transcript_6787/g.17780  ORF Transcript_6787/g.17780 Transcript_6787/m.17780 type:complete len:238 (-) Transcript_6787:157-870(-)
MRGLRASAATSATELFSSARQSCLHTSRFRSYGEASGTPAEARRRETDALHAEKAATSACSSSSALVPASHAGRSGRPRSIPCSACSGISLTRASIGREASARRCWTDKSSSRANSDVSLLSLPDLASCCCSGSSPPPPLSDWLAGWRAATAMLLRRQRSSSSSSSLRVASSRVAFCCRFSCIAAFLCLPVFPPRTSPPPPRPPPRPPPSPPRVMPPCSCASLDSLPCSSLTALCAF